MHIFIINLNQIHYFKKSLFFYVLIGGEIPWGMVLLGFADPIDSSVLLKCHHH